MSQGREVWRECMRWLTDVGVLAPDFQETATMEQFVAAFRDGVLLCRIADALSPGAIDRRDITPIPSSQFHCIRNTSHFLNWCHQSIKIPHEDLFQAPDVFHMHDFLKVLKTLSILSDSELALNKGLIPFPERQSSSGQHTPNRSSTTGLSGAGQRVFSPTHGEEEIYQQLPSMLDQLPPNENIYTVNYQNLRQDSEEKVYDFLVKKPGAYARATPSDLHLENYVESLNMLSKKFQTPLASVLKAEDHRIIFMNISELWSFHCVFFEKLKRGVLQELRIDKADSRESIADAFKTHKMDFTKYGSYVIGMDESRTRIEKVEKNPDIKQKIEECYKSITLQFKLPELLCLPFQRILKYSLLLKELQSATDLGPEHDKLAEAKLAMDDVNEFVNELKRDAEKKVHVEQMQASITDLQMPENMALIDYGRDQKDEEVKMSEVTSSSSEGKFKPRHIFLFDKVLIVCKANRNNTYTYKGAYIVSEWKVDRGEASKENAPQNGFGGTIRKLGQSQHILVLIRSSLHAAQQNDDSVRTIRLSFKSEGQKKAWKEAFERARQNVCPNTGKSDHIVHYTSFAENTARERKENWPAVCDVCRKFLKGLFFQGYRCDRCYQFMHRECIPLSAPCRGRRGSSVVSITASASFSGTTSNGGAHGARSRRTTSYAGSSYLPGEKVVTVQRQTSTDPAMLNFDSDAVLEIVHCNSNNTVTARPISSPGSTGLVPITAIRKMRSPSSGLLNTVVGVHTSPSVESPNGRGTSVQRKDSTILPRQPPLSTLPVVNPSMEYVNTEVSVQQWYMGEWSREESEKRLKAQPNGTFLVRFSPKKRQFVISISYAGEVKHTVIEEPADGTYYLDESNKFHSIVELINYYREHNMKESFQSLDTKLTEPYRECKRYRAIHAYESKEPKFLELRVDDVVTLVDTVGEDRGWWKGQVGDRVGFFPLNYVEEIPEDRTR